MNRGDLIETFGISVSQASTDLSRYLGMAPDNMAYDKSARTYIRGAKFEPLFLKPDASCFLPHLRSVADGILDRIAAWIGQFPSCDAAPMPSRAVNGKTLRSVVAAIRRRFLAMPPSDQNLHAINLAAVRIGFRDGY